MTSSYSQAATLGKDIIILGDLNCDMLSPTKPEYRILSELCSMLNLSQLISEPTRVTELTESLIDVILTPSKDLIKESNVLQTTISDHFLVSCTLTLKHPKSDPPIITTRSFKNFNIESFCKDISEAPWDAVTIFDHIDDQVSSFNKLFLDILDQHAPIKSFKAKHKKSHVIPAEIKELMLKRDESLKHARMTKHPSDWEAYRILRQQVKSNIRATESKYVREEITTNQSNKSSVWKIVRQCLNPYGSSNLQYSRDTQEVSNTFNEYFVSVGGTAANKAKQLAIDHGLPACPSTSHDPPSFPSVEDDASPKFIFERVSAETVKNVITGMPNNKVPGHDKIGINVIKACLPHILNVITQVFNTSLMSGCFPKDLENSRGSGSS